MVLSHPPIDLSGLDGARVEAMAGPPAQVAATLAERGLTRLYVDGGRTIQGFLRDGLVDRLFGSLPVDVRLRHVATQTFPGGPVTTEYAVIR